MHEYLFQTAAGRHWKTVGVNHHHGIVVPLFSLHSNTSCGIGEFPDLLPLFPWLKENNMDVLQLLPINDTGHDSSPYSALSAYALNPLHLGLHQLPNVSSERLQSLQKLNTTQRVDYNAVRQEKEKFLREYYHQNYDNYAKDPFYIYFTNENAFWLQPYAKFKALKIRNQWKSWETWSQTPEDANEINFHIFVQFLCFKQFIDVKQTAIQHGIHLMGDIPILINRESADVWHHPEIFQLQYSAGAPPDMYSEEGQKWGFPIYNWEVLASQNYRWWIERLKLASDCYTIYRIDHVVGFYRIWSIPLASKPKEGFFIPKDESTWIPHGENLMKMMINSCDMLPIGEDLGTIPPPVRVNLRQLGICGTKVMRWERRWNEDRGFIDPKDYPCESLTTVSTHDSETLYQWWKNQPEEGKLYASTVGWQYTPELTQEQRISILKASHHSNSLFHINLLQEYLALVPNMTWPNPDDERINRPGIIADSNWSYKFRPSVEEIVTNQPLKSHLQQIVFKA